MFFKIFITALVASPFGDGKYWYLRQDLIWKSKSGQTINVPQGFVTDFTSVPRPIWWLFPPWAKYGNAAVVHDYCYWNQTYTRKEADAMILEGMEDMGVYWITRRLIHGALRVFGQIAWCRNQREKSANHIRIIKNQNWPPSQTTTWKEYRKELESQG
jgi:hypothetical protein